MSAFRTLALAVGLLPCFQLAAQQPAPQVVAPERGAIDAAGKFVPTKTAPDQPREKVESEENKQREALRVLPDGENRYRIGEITFDRARREVTIPATVNMDTGVVEYALVSESGKLHEALFSTKANPRAIHLACLLLGLPKEGEDKPDDAGCEVKVNVAWDTNGPAVLHELANLVVTSETPDAPADAKPLAGGPWRYVSSMMGPGGFAAAAEGSIIALIHDPAALMVNPRESASRDDVHVANRNLIPHKGSPVRIILTLPAPSAKP
jgi:hypothetical protein